MWVGRLASVERNALGVEVVDKAVFLGTNLLDLCQGRIFKHLGIVLHAHNAELVGGHDAAQFLFVGVAEHDAAHEEFPGGVEQSALLQVGVLVGHEPLPATCAENVVYAIDGLAGDGCVLPRRKVSTLVGAEKSAV